jgi:lipopolysaccharide export system ATP-binding protein
MQDILEVDSVIKSFDTRQVLTDIYLKCCKGDIIGLLGRNGTGKSTLMKIIFGTLSAENRFIRINNRVLEKPYLSKDLIMYLPQDSFLPATLKVKEVVGLYFNGEGLVDILNDQILEKVAETKISNLSGGEGRYLEIKLLLFSKAKFVLLDEPFNGIAPIIIDSIKEIIKTQSESKGIILTDHDYNNVLDVANKYYLLFDGGLKEMRNKADFIEWGYIPESRR